MDNINTIQSQKEPEPIVSELYKCEQTDGENPEKCSCPTRTSPPPVPEHIPFPPTEQNIPKLKAWILQKYRSSAFNCCHNQKLPLVKETAPMNLYEDENA